MSDKPYTNMTSEEARAMLDKFNQTDIGGFLKAVKAGMPTKDTKYAPAPVKTGSIAPVVPGGDIHRHIASIMYGVEPGEVTTAQRVAAKVQNYPYLYANNLSYEDAVPLMEAQARAFAAAREKAESEGGE
jgi:hypothetical protein